MSSVTMIRMRMVNPGPLCKYLCGRLVADPLDEKRLALVCDTLCKYGGFTEDRSALSCHLAADVATKQNKNKHEQMIRNQCETVPFQDA